MIRRRKVEPKYQSATDFYRVTTEKLENVNERSFVLLLRISTPIILFILNGEERNGSGRREKQLKKIGRREKGRKKNRENQSIKREKEECSLKNVT